MVTHNYCMRTSCLCLGYILFSFYFGCVNSKSASNQNHINVEVSKCSDSPLGIQNEPWRINIPSYPFGVNLTLRYKYPNKWEN